MLLVCARRVKICGWQMRLSLADGRSCHHWSDSLSSSKQEASKASVFWKKNVVCKKGVLEGGGPWPNLSVDLLHSQLFLCQKFLRLCAGDLAKLTGEPLTFSAWQAVQNERSFYREIRCFFSLFLCLSIFLSLFMNIFFLNQLLNAK